MKNSVIGLAVLLALSSTAFAAPKYANGPALGIKKAVINISNGPTVTWVKVNGQDLLQISVDGEYNYDNAWTYDKIEVTLTFSDSTAQPPGSFAAGQTIVIQPEGAGLINPPPKWNAIFTVPLPPPPAQGAWDTVIVKAKITVTKPQNNPETDSHAKDAGIPAKPKALPGGEED